MLALVFVCFVSKLRSMIHRNTFRGIQLKGESMWKKLLTTCLLALFGCTQVADNSSQIPVVTEHSDLERHVGKVITIRGRVTNTKIPSIIGVDVESDDPDLRGEIAEATGVLQKWTVTEQQLEETIEKHGMTANRGAGTFYRLKEANSNYMVKVRRP